MFSATLSGHGAFTNGFSGLANSKAVVAMNEAGEFGFLPGENEPYSPIGGRKTLALVLDCLVFRSHDFGAAVHITKGQAF